MLRLLVLIVLLSASVVLGSSADEERPVLLSTKGGKGSTAWPSIDALEKAAAAGDLRACADLGDMLATGTGMPADVARAVPLLEKAAAAGQPTAAFRLGKLYETGDGVRRDPARSVGYYKTAAAGGAAEAFYNVGAAYASARGVPRDFAEALAWMILAAQHGAPDSGEKAIRAQIEKMRRPELIKQGEARAVALAAELAETAKSFAPTNAPGGGTSSPAKRPRYVRGGTLPLPPPKVTTPSVSAKLPVPANSEADDPGPPVTILGINAQSLEWRSFNALQRAADRGEPDALYALGKLLLEGDKLPGDVTPDLDRALLLLDRGATAGSLDAAFRLAELYTTGRKVPQNDALAFKYTLQAATGGARSAIFNLGAFYANGRGTQKNYTEALAWLITAEHFGASPAAAAKIRSYLKSSAPNEIPKAEKRAEELKRTIEAARGAKP